MENIIVAFLLTLVAGLSTGIGSLIAFVSNSTNRRFLSVSLGFSAGVMVYVSMLEILPKAAESFAGSFNERLSMTIAVISFFGGMFLIALIDKLLPSEENPHEVKLIEDCRKNGGTDCERLAASGRLRRIGIFTALAVGIHNFPEGLATFVSALQEPSLAIPIVAAIALHNIPEGIAVSVPIYQATGSKKKAFGLSFMSGLAEPIGALIGWLILMPFMNNIVYGVIFAMVAGIMVFISFDELLPAAREYGEHHLSIYGLIGGMAVMAVSLILFM